MKKHLLAVAIAFTGIANAQTWSEDFSSTTAQSLPANWLQINNDGLTVASNLSSFNFGTNAWVTNNMSSLYPAYGRLVMSTSWYSPAGVADDWLITPSFTVPAGAYLVWEGLAVEAGFQDGYLVKISTTGTNIASFTTNLLTVPQENTTWTDRSINLSAYSTQTVRIAFVNNSNDMNRLYLDNIKVIIPQPNDGSVVDNSVPTRYSVGAGLQTISGSFKSFGVNTATTAVLNYKVNNSAVTSQTFNLGSLSYGQSTNYSFSTQANMSLGTNKIKVWVTSVNGSAETVLTNDTAVSYAYVASQARTRNALIEEFSSSTCNPCAALNVNFDPLLNSNNANTGGQVNAIKYQVNWPSPGNDPSYNPHGAARVDHYAINAAPTALMNGKTEMANHDQAEIDAGKAEVAYADIVANISVAGTNVTGNATITPYVNIPANSPLKLFQVLLQNYYNYPGAVTTQKDYYHIMRKMSPNGWGSNQAVTDGTPFNVSYNLNTTNVATPAQNSYDFWSMTNLNYEYVVFVQDTISNDILNSGSAQTSISVGLVELKKDSKIGVYPNPAKDFAVVGVKLEKESKIDIQIYDVTGRVVYSNKNAQVMAGQNEIRINTSEFATGTYNIVVNTNEGTFKEKLIVSK